MENEKYRLGDLIAALFEEAKRFTSDQVEQTALVSAALQDLLEGKIRPLRPIALRIRRA
jgi:hypothetical protein